MTRRKGPVYGEIRVTLPRFVIITLRKMVKDANAKRTDEQRWTVSKLLEQWLLNALNKEKPSIWEATGRESAEFRRTAEAWLRMIVKGE